MGWFDEEECGVSQSVSRSSHQAAQGAGRAALCLTNQHASILLRTEVLLASERHDLEARVDEEGELCARGDVLVDAPVQLAEGGEPRRAHPDDEVLVRHALRERVGGCWSH